MGLQLERPLVFFDLETTGTSIVNDRIVQIGAIKLFPDGRTEVKNRLVNPQMPIPEGASAVHGIYDKDVVNEPKFRQLAKAFYGWLKDSDLVGYNSDNFDIPMLAEEFARAGIEYPTPDTHFVDVIKLERYVNSHKLGDTYQRYTGEELLDAHDAIADIEATKTILEKQLEKHDDLPITVKELEALFVEEGKERVDFAGKIYRHEGELYWNFGKLRDQPIRADKGYADWVLRGEFAENTKKFVRAAFEG